VTFHDQVIAFDRGGAIALATRLPIGLQRRGGWADTSVALPRRPMLDAMTGRRFEGGLTLATELFERYRTWLGPRIVS